jgi:SAM-dependent methyltransferase
MELSKLQETWDALGQIDPFWAILSRPGKLGNKWDIDEFFRTGEREIDGVMTYVESLGVSIRRRKVLDFGCGAGRLSLALCRHFDECDGVDIAPSMIELARRFNRFPDRCRFHLNSGSDLRLFDDRTFDFIYCNIVLQHMEPRYSTAYVAEFLRVLDTNGLAVFQLPSQMLIGGGSGHTVDATLPDSAFRGKIRILDAPAQVDSGSLHPIKVRVRNLSDCSWPGLGTRAGVYPVRLGNRWLRESDGVVIEDGARADFPNPLPPGDQIDLTLTVMAPRTRGDFKLQVDLLQEMVGWFRDRGSFAAQVPIRVHGAADPAKDSVLVPIIEMHSVPREELETVVAANGGEMLDVREDEQAGHEWRSLRYCVRKRQ